MNPTIISFYTNDWHYPQYADKLRDDCDRLGLDHHIVEKPSTKTYDGNCNIKPYFIEEALVELKKPVVWMDVDGSINQFPDVFNDDLAARCDIAGFQSQRDHTKIHVATIWFAYSETTLDFIRTWQQRSMDFIDDGAFQTSLASTSNIRIETLPQQYFEILPWPHSPVTDSHYFVHRLSQSDIKMEYKRLSEAQ